MQMNRTKLMFTIESSMESKDRHFWMTRFSIIVTNFEQSVAVSKSVGLTLFAGFLQYHSLILACFAKRQNSSAKFMNFHSKSLFFS